MSGQTRPQGMFDKGAVDAVLFDLDGTLMDTDDQQVEAIARRLMRLRWPRPHRTARRVVMAAETPANGLLTILDILGLDGPLMSLSRKLNRLRGWHEPVGFRIVADTREMLVELAVHYRLGVVTTRSSHDAQAFLGQYDLQDAFATIVTCESTRRLKPHPAPVHYAAQQLDVPVSRCVMVGDTTVDVKSARRAGAWAVGVLCGFGEQEELERAGAHAILESTAQFPSLL